MYNVLLIVVTSKTIKIGAAKGCQGLPNDEDLKTARDVYHDDLLYDELEIRFKTMASQMTDDGGSLKQQDTCFLKSQCYQQPMPALLHLKMYVRLNFGFMTLLLVNLGVLFLVVLLHSSNIFAMGFIILNSL